LREIIPNPILIAWFLILSQFPTPFSFGFSFQLLAIDLFLRGKDHFSHPYAIVGMS
jgi:hypothetical protein